MDINLSFVTWELCNWSSDRDLLVVTWCLPDASWCFETIFFWKFSAYLKISSFFSFLYVLLSCSHFYCFSPLKTISKPLAASSYTLCQSLLTFLFPLTSQMYIFWTVDQNSWRKYDFLFQEVSQKWQGIDLIKICVIGNYTFIWVQKKEERLALEVRIISWGRLYFCFVNNKAEGLPWLSSS